MNEKRKSRMAVLSCIMGILFGGAVLFATPLVAGLAATLAPSFSAPGSADAYLLPCLFLFLGSGFLSFCLGIVAVIRIKFVDKSLTGMPFAVAGISIPIVVVMNATFQALR